MTIDEAKAICNELTDITLKFWRSTTSSEKENFRQLFENKHKSIRTAGFKIRRWRDHGVPMYAPRIDRHVDMINIASNKPDGLKIKNDCTTRCISFCTGIDYSLIREEQLRNAKILGSIYTWRHDRVWEQSLLNRGFVKITLKRHVSRATFIRLSKSFSLNEGIIATMSSDHVAAIDMKERKILDTWNSSGGRILKIYVPASQEIAYKKWLYDINCY